MCTILDTRYIVMNRTEISVLVELMLKYKTDGKYN